MSIIPLKKSILFILIGIMVLSCTCGIAESEIKYGAGSSQSDYVSVTVFNIDTGKTSAESWTYVTATQCFWAEAIKIQYNGIYYWDPIRAYDFYGKAVPGKAGKAASVTTIGNGSYSHSSMTLTANLSSISTSGSRYSNFSVNNSGNILSSGGESSFSKTFNSFSFSIRASVIQ